MASPTCIVRTVAGFNERGFKDGPAMLARFCFPSHVCVGLNNEIYVADTGNNCVRMLSDDNLVATVAGCGAPGYRNGVGAAVMFNRPMGLAVRHNGDILVCDTNNHCIRVICAKGDSIATLYGCKSSPRFLDGLRCRFNQPTKIVVNAEGDTYITDNGNERIRFVNKKTSVASTIMPSGSDSMAHNHSGRDVCSNLSGLCMDHEKRLWFFNSVRPKQLLTSQISTSSFGLFCMYREATQTQKSVLPGLMRSMYEKSYLADIVFSVRSKTFSAHICVLVSRSDYFQNMFRDDTGFCEFLRERKHLEYPDFCPDAFELFLVYVYTNEVGNVKNVNTLVQLCVIADYFCEEGLRMIALSRLESLISLLNILDLVRQDSVKNISCLRKVCFTFISKN